MSNEKKKILVTGGAGFIGSALIRYLINETNHEVMNVDKITYAGNLESLSSITNDPRYSFEKVDITSGKHISRILREYEPDLVMHLAAESHVDRSIEGPGEFIQTNIVGTYTMLEMCKNYWLSRENIKKNDFRFHHISTDEVYGDLQHPDNSSQSSVLPLFTESTPYAPSSPYSASKAGADHLVRAWSRTFGLPVIITNCSNNYGPYQFPEKLIPLVILNALEGKSLPIYGSGNQIRDWLYVDDHVRALVLVAMRGIVGETYNIGCHNEQSNLDVVRLICSVLDDLKPAKSLGLKIEKYSDLIKYVKDRPGHDMRYAIDASKIKNELGWVPAETFESGINKTIRWYFENLDWCKRVQDDTYKNKG